MCEQTPVDYKDGDVVWVKLGLCWWPGEVYDLEKLPPEWLPNYKKPPLVAVKFFDETTYEFVRSYRKIYSYNCTRKNDFIRRGLDLYRAKNTYMEKFPADVSIAEKKTNGDPNIIDDPMFSPEKKKISFTALLFGSSKSKKIKKTINKSRRSSSSSRNTSSTTPYKTMRGKITHPRFLGKKDDHEIRILVQSPDKSDLENTEIEPTYNCSSCGFTTSRIDVIVLHNKSHIQGVYNTPTSSLKKPKSHLIKKGKKIKMTRSKTSSIWEDLDLIDKGLLISTESTDEELNDEVEDKEKPMGKRKKNKRKPKKVETKKEINKVDIRNHLLAEWDEDSDAEENVTLNTSYQSTDSDLSTTKVDIGNETSKKEEDKSCFDFEEEEDVIIGTSTGRKIPRVIPPPEKQKSSDDLDSSVSESNLEAQPKELDRSIDSDFSENQLSESSTRLIENITLQDVLSIVGTTSTCLGTVENKNIDLEMTAEKTCLSDTEKNDIAIETINTEKELRIESEESQTDELSENAFKEVLESTTVPDLPELPHLLKFEQNFHNSNSMQFCDKNEKSENVDDKQKVTKIEVKEGNDFSSKLINPKKRFVKTFEDFEQQLNNEQKKLEMLSKQLSEVSNVESPLIETHETPNKTLEDSPSIKDDNIKEVLENEKDIFLTDVDKLIVSDPVETASLSLESTSLESTGSEDLSESQDSKTVDMSDEISKSSEVTLTSTSYSEDIESSDNCEYNKTLTLQIPEIEETKPFEMEETLDLLDLEQEPTIVQVEPAQVLDEKKTVEVVQVGPVMETQIEMQTHNNGIIFNENHLEYSKENNVDITTTVIATPEIKSNGITEMTSCTFDENLKVDEDKVPSTASLDNDDVIGEVMIVNDLEIPIIPDVISKTDEDIKEVTSKDMESMDTDVNFTCTNIDNKESEDLSALTTLATISELSTNLDVQCSSSDEKSKLIEDNLVLTSNIINEKEKGNLTFVTEDDLAEGQVEITESSISNSKTIPISLSNFSVDFTDSIQNLTTSVSLQNEPKDNFEAISPLIKKRKYSLEMEQTDSIEKSLGKVFQDDKCTSNDNLLDCSNSTDDQIPSLLDCTNQSENKSDYTDEECTSEYTSSSKLLEILTDGKPKITQTDIPLIIQKSPSIFDMSKKLEGKLQTNLIPNENKMKVSKYGSKFSKTTKPIILSEKIIKPVAELSDSVSVQKITSKRNTQDIEDIDTFIIQKPKKMLISEDEDVKHKMVTPPLLPKKASRGKAKILQQTIIKPATDVSQISTPQLTVDDNMFDINSMPIVLGDQIIPAESIECMPSIITDTSNKNVVSSVITTTTSQNEQIKMLKSTVTTTQPLLVKTYSSSQKGKPSKVFQTTSTKVTKTNPSIISRSGKSEKFIIIPQSASSNNPSKYNVGKKSQITKRTSSIILPTPVSQSKVQNPPVSEPTGNKIMIVTNQQGQQSRVLLTPAQQKLLGYQNTAGSKLVKSTFKSNILQKSSSNKNTISSPKMQSTVSHALVNTKGEVLSTNPNLIMADGQVLMPLKSQQIRSTKMDIQKPSKKVQLEHQKVLLQEGLNTLRTSSIPASQKTIVIKNQQGQIVKKFHGTDSAFLEQQVAEQVQAIKASGSFNAHKTKQETSTSKMKSISKRAHPKKVYTESARHANKMEFTTPKPQKTETSLPPLTPISPKKVDPMFSQPVPKTEETKGDATKDQRQLIIQDALGNQTTITEGQILALPSGDTIDGQPQSYMLVTLDETGNIVPLNNETLLSLDPNLCLGGDLSNMVLQIDDSAKSGSSTIIKPSCVKENQNVVEDIKKEPDPPVAVQDHYLENKIVSPNLENKDLTANVGAVQTVTCNIGTDPNQQLIITGDPISAQKFIESLTEGNPDLANLLANAEGNILIQTDEQHILINADSENQVLLPINSDRLSASETSEGDGNPIFATQPIKNQDILAAALADTDVFQQEQATSLSQSKITQSQLSPNSSLYPTGVGNVLETTLSLSSPIMTPLEVPSTNNKKIPDDETDILTSEVPKNVDLPITITDPNISQTVSQQHVASLIANDLASNLELPLTITDQSVPLTSAEMNSPSYVYSLPSLDESEDINQKAFSGPISMPLLTEDPQENSSNKNIEMKDDLSDDTIDIKKDTSIICDSDIGTSPKKSLEGSSSLMDLFESRRLSLSECIKDRRKLKQSVFLRTMDSAEGLCTLGGSMCSSLSEPPPDMFDLGVVEGSFVRNKIKSQIDTCIPDISRLSKSSDLNLEDNLSTEQCNEPYIKFETYNTENRRDNLQSTNLPLNSESNSPVVNIDENSCEIPVQPQIVTDLTSSFESNETTGFTDFDSNKRSAANDGIENEKKKIKFD